jgi:membrane-bound lytic murein transglycosylase C
LDFLSFGNNIGLGATYLSVLLYGYRIKSIQNVTSRVYSATSGYNSRPGNVVRAFTGSTKQPKEVAAKTDSMEPDGASDHLRSKLPFAETRDCLPRVSTARGHYKALF